MRTLLAALTLTLLTGALAAPARAQTVAEVIRANPDFSEFVDLAKKTDLTSQLSGSGPVTVFVPVNAAWGNLTPGTLQRALQNKRYGEIRAVLLYHMVPGLYPPDRFRDYTQLKTLDGQPLAIGVSGGHIYLNTFAISGTPVKASNGLVYTIYNVLIPGIIQAK